MHKLKDIINWSSDLYIIRFKSDLNNCIYPFSVLFFYPSGDPFMRLMWTARNFNGNSVKEIQY